MAKQLVTFEQGSPTTGDSGERGNSALAGGGQTSVKPIGDGERVSQTVLNRDTENIRRRTESLRTSAEELLYRVDNEAWFFSAGNAAGVGAAQNIPTIDAWDTSGGASDGTFVTTEPMVVNGIATPDTDKQESTVYNFPVASSTASLTISLTAAKRAYNLANNIRIKWLSATAAELATALVPGRCDAVVSGDTEHILTITIETLLTQVAHIDTALTAISGDLTTMGITFITAGNNATSVVMGDLVSPNPDDDYQLSKTYERNLYYLPVATFSDYFTANPGLQDGDTLAIEFADFATKRATCLANTNTTINMSSLFNTRTYPERIANCIPLCKRIGDVLVWRDGTYVQPNQVAALVFGEHGRTVERVLNAATTINLAAHTTAGPLTADPFSLTASPLQTNLENMTDAVNNKPSLDTDEIVSADWAFTGHFNVNMPAGPPPGFLNEHFIGHPAYTTDQINKLFLDVATGVSAVTDASRGLTTLRVYNSMAAAITVSQLKAASMEVYVSQGTITGSSLGANINVSVVGTGVTNNAKGLNLSVLCQETATFMVGATLTVDASAGSTVSTIGNMEVFTNCQTTVNTIRGRYVEEDVAGTATITGEFRGIHHEIDIHAGAGAHALTGGFIGEYLLVAIDKELTLASDPFHGKLATYSIEANIGNDVYLDSISYVQDSDIVSGNLYGRHLSIDLTGPSQVSSVYGYRADILTDSSTTNGAVYALYTSVEANASSLYYGYYSRLDVQDSIVSFNGINSYVNVASAGDVSNASYGMQSTVIFSVGSTKNSNVITAVFGNLEFNAVASGSLSVPTLVGTHNRITGGLTGDCGDGYSVGTFNEVGSVGTLGGVFGTYSEVRGSSAHTITGEFGLVGHYVELDNGSGLSDTYALISRAMDSRHNIRLDCYSNVSENGNYIDMRTSRGALGSLAATQSTDVYGELKFWGVDTESTWYEAASIRVVQIGAATASETFTTMTLAANDTIIKLYGDSPSYIILGASIVTVQATNGTGNPDADAASIIQRTNSNDITNIDNGQSGQLLVIYNDASAVVTYTNVGNITVGGTIADGASQLFIRSVNAWSPVS